VHERRAVQVENGQTLAQAQEQLQHLSLAPSLIARLHFLQHRPQCAALTIMRESAARARAHAHAHTPTAPTAPPPPHTAPKQKETKGIYPVEWEEEEDLIARGGGGRGALGVVHQRHDVGVRARREHLDLQLGPLVKQDTTTTTRMPRFSSSRSTTD
jgi:hypothetical protein